METWLQIAAIILGNFGTIYMFRREIRDDQKHLDNRWYAAIKSIECELKDFHEKLYEIERQRIKKK